MDISTAGLTADQWGFLAFSGTSAQAAAELAAAHGIRGAGNCLVSDAEGRSLSVEFNGGGVSIVPAKAGIATHANHPEGANTAPRELEDYATAGLTEGDREDSRYRMHGLWAQFNAERGRLAAPKVMQILADHSW